MSKRSEAKAHNERTLVDISRWIEAAKGRADAVLRKVLHDISYGIVLRTPVDTGRLRGNWQLGVDTVPRGQSENTGDPSFSGITTATFGHTYYIANNLPYARVVEYGLYPDPPKGGAGKTVGGYSTQAPQGMLRITVSEYESYLRNAIISTKGG